MVGLALCDSTRQQRLISRMVPFNAKLLKDFPKWFIGSLILLYLLSLLNYVTYSGQIGKNVVKLTDAELSERLKSNLLLQHHQRELIENETATTALKNVKVLCWILTMPANHDTRAIHVKNTWGRRCDKIIFMSSKYNESLPSIDLGYNETRNYLWGKTKSAFKYVYNHHLNGYDWFMKADDDTYVIMENLRYLLSSYNPDEDAIWFGSRFKPFNKQGYMSGGGGYVLSRQALRLFAEKSLPNPSFCKEDDIGAEDVEMGKCLNNVGVVAGDSRDSEGRGRFFPFDPPSHVPPDTVPYEWYINYRYYDIKTGPECCSDLAISFHYIQPKKMYELEYLIYHLHPFGTKHPDIFPPPLPKDKFSATSRFLREYYAKARGLHNFLEKYDKITFIQKKVNESQEQTSSTSATTASGDFAKTIETTQNAIGNKNSSATSKRITYVFVTARQAQENEPDFTIANFSSSSTAYFTTSKSMDSTTPIFSSSIDIITSASSNTSVLTPSTTSNASYITAIKSSEIINYADHYSVATNSAENFNNTSSLSAFASNETITNITDISDDLFLVQDQLMNQTLLLSGLLTI